MQTVGLRLALSLALLLVAGVGSAATADYFPPRGAWERKAPAELGIDAARLNGAIAYAVANENPS